MSITSNPVVTAGMKETAENNKLTMMKVQFYDKIVELGKKKGAFIETQKPFETDIGIVSFSQK